MPAEQDEKLSNEQTAIDNLVEGEYQSDDVDDEEVPEEFRLDFDDDDTDAEAGSAGDTETSADTAEVDADVDPIEAMKAEVAALRKELANRDKRNSDTFRDWERKNHELLEAKKKLASYEDGQADSGDGDDDDSESYLTKSERAALAKLAEIDALKEQLAQLSQSQREQRWLALETDVKKTHADYDTVIAEFETAFQADEALQAQFRERGATPAVAYEMGVNLRKTQLMLKDPDAYREQMKQELLAEISQGRQRPRDVKSEAEDTQAATLSGVTSKKSVKATGRASWEPHDILDEVIGERQARR